YQLFINLTYAVSCAAACPSATASSLGPARRCGVTWAGYSARHRRQVADVAIGHAEERDDGGLVGCNAVEIAHPYDRAAEATVCCILPRTVDWCPAVWFRLDRSRSPVQPPLHSRPSRPSEPPSPDASCSFPV